MKTNEIYALLKEASSSMTPNKRINEIHGELIGALRKRLGDSVDSEAENALDGLLGTLFVEMNRHMKDLLPLMLPAFVLLCGDYDDSYIGELDMNEIKELFSKDYITIPSDFIPIGKKEAEENKEYYRQKLIDGVFNPSAQFNKCDGDL